MNSPATSPSGFHNPNLSREAPLASTPHKFTHLHLHTSYSLLDGAIRIPSLMKHVKAQGMDAVAITDHGNMFGAVEFYKAAVKEGVKPIIGCEFYVAPGDRREKRNVERISDGGNYHLVILAQNETGYRNLIKLASRSYTEGYYRKPRIDYDILAQHNEGLICLTACLGGEVQQKVLREKKEEAAKLAGHLREVFGRERFFLEIQEHGLPEEKIVAKANLEIAKMHDIPLVLTNDSHFLLPEDQEAQEILLRINQKKTIQEKLYFSFNKEFHVKNPAEMARLFPELPEAMHNTQLIKEMCDLNFEFGNPLLPRFDVPEGYTLDSWLRHLAEEGLKRRYPTITPQIQERFEFEYKTITSMDFSGYFLIVQDFINWAKKNDVPVGPGRGSAAGSIIAYSLGITDIEPLRYGLLFERFLNPDRKEMPDIDVDFCTEKREHVINYVRNKYGSDKVGQIITYGKMAAKACLKDVARVLDINFQEANNISKMFPNVLNITIEEALANSKDLKSYAESGEVQKKLFSVARTLEGNTRHTGIHAAGVVIAPKPLEELVPLATVANKSDPKSKERVPVVQYDMGAITDVGLVKMDFLGLRNLTIIDDCLKGIERRTGQKIDLSRLDLNNKKAYELLQRGDVAGVFQVESGGMREFVIRIHPERFEDIIAVIALFRPGPLEAGMAESFIKRKNGQERVAYPHPNLKEILQDTYGVIVYQEQIMQVARIIGGFTPGEADGLRKAMGKKILDKMAALKEKFLEGAKHQGYDLKFASAYYDQMAEFAKYGFNKSHSAAYAFIVYQTAYLKANYPTDYMRAVLNSIDSTDDLVPYINSCRGMGIEILGPDINESELKFTYIKEGVLRFGLGSIKNVGTNAVESILDARKRIGQNGFVSFFNFAEEVDLRSCNKRTIESLIYAGAFQSLGYTRKTLLASIDLAYSHGQRKQTDKNAGQFSLFDNAPDAGLEQEPIPRGDGAEEFSESELLRLEKSVLGIYFSGHPLAKYQRVLSKIRVYSISQLPNCQAHQKVELAGIIADYKLKQTKAKKEMCRLVIEDTTGSIEAMVFPRVFASLKPEIEQSYKDEMPIIIQGRVEKREETGTVSLLLESINPLTQEFINEKQEKSLHLRLKGESMGPDILKSLKLILQQYRGNLRLYFHVEQAGQGSTVIRAHDSFRVDYSEDLVHRLATLTQVEAIHLSIGDQLSELFLRTQC